MSVRAGIAAVALAGCDVVFGLPGFTHETRPRDAGVDIDATPPDVGIDAPLVPFNCNTILMSDPGSPSGTYQIDPDGDDGSPPLTVTCDMTTAGGGWTIMFAASSANLNANPLAYTTISPTLLATAQDALIAFRDASLTALPGSATFAMPADWRTDTPFDYVAKDVAVMASVDGAAPIAGTLRYGTQDFQMYCNGGWVNDKPWGRVCIDGTTAPFYSGFDTGNGDTCTDSSKIWNANGCTAARQFSIAVR